MARFPVLIRSPLASAQIRAQFLRLNRLRKRHVLRKQWNRDLLDRTRFYFQLRRPHSRLDEMPGLIQEAEAIVRRARGSPEAKKELEGILARVKKRSEHLSLVSYEVRHNHVSPNQLFDTILTQQSAHARRKYRAPIADREKVRVAIDQLGIHFFLPKSYSRALDSVISSFERERIGVSVSLDVALPVKDTRVKLSRLPVSFTIDNGLDNQGTERHERWHDFEKQFERPLTETLRRVIQQKNWVLIEKGVNDWFKGELSATLAEGELTDSFPERVSDFFTIVRKDLRDTGVRSTRFFALLEKREKELMDVIHLANVAVVIAYSQFGGVLSRNSSISKKQEQKLVVAHTLVAGIVTSSTLPQLRPRFVRLIRTMKKINPPAVPRMATAL